MGVINTIEKQVNEEEKILTDNNPDHLHPNVKKYWFISNVTATSFLILFLATPFIMGAVFLGGLFWVAIITIAAAVMICLSAVLVMVLVNLEYENITFLVKDDSLTINKGILFKQSSTLPFNRVQNVTIFSGPIERIFGLSTITIGTAGWGSGRLQGVSNPELLRDIILKRVSRAKNNGL